MLRQIGEKSWEFNRKVWNIFIDFSQAYDSVHRESLWRILVSFSVPGKIVNLLKACYAHTQGRVRVGGELSDCFNITSGLKQGCPLSTILFNFALEWVMRKTPLPPDPVTSTTPSATASPMQTMLICWGRNSTHGTHTSVHLEAMERGLD